MTFGVFLLFFSHCFSPRKMKTGRGMSHFTGRYEGSLLENKIRVEGLEGVLSYASIEGGIGAGKSTFLDLWKQFIKKHRSDAADPAHIDEENPDKDYFLLVEEPVDLWTARTHKVGDEMLSLLEIFYRNRDQMAFSFQCYTFNTRLRRLKEALRRIVPTNFPRRIHVISERSLLGDKIFLEANAKTSDSTTMKYEVFIYNDFHENVCEELLKFHSTIIHIPTPPSECRQRIKTRDRVEECGIPDAYLTAIGEGHQAMIQNFSGSIFEMNDFKNPMSKEERKHYVYSFAEKYKESVKMIHLK